MNPRCRPARSAGTEAQPSRQERLQSVAPRGPWAGAGRPAPTGWGEPRVGRQPRRTEAGVPLTRLGDAPRRRPAPTDGGRPLTRLGVAPRRRSAPPARAGHRRGFVSLPDTDPHHVLAEPPLTRLGVAPRHRSAPLPRWVATDAAWRRPTASIRTTPHRPATDAAWRCPATSTRTAPRPRRHRRGLTSPRDTNPHHSLTAPLPRRTTPLPHHSLAAPPPTPLGVAVRRRPALPWRRPVRRPAAQPARGLSAADRPPGTPRPPVRRPARAAPSRPAPARARRRGGSCPVRRRARAAAAARPRTRRVG